MTVLDAFAIEALLNGEPAARQVASVVKTEPEVWVAALNLAEVIDRMIRVHGVDLFGLRGDLAVLGLIVVVLDEAGAYRAAGLRTTHYHRTRRPVSLADCAAAAVALDRGEPLATSDPPLIDLVLAEGGDILALPGSDGSVYDPR